MTTRPARPERRILLTGFEPFGGDAINPSWQVAQALRGECWHGHEVVAELLPCTFAAAIPALQAALRRHRPRCVLALGQAGRRVISLERVAINVDDARIPDNAGAQPVDRPVRRGAPAAYFSTLPLKAMLQALRTAGIAAEVSQTAGTFVCNHVFYGLMHTLRGRRDVRGGFVHVPMLPQQARAHGRDDGMALETMVAGVRLAGETAAATRRDAVVAAGAID